MSLGKIDYLSKLQTLSVFLILNGTAKTKLATLVFLYYEEIVKNSIDTISSYKIAREAATEPPSISIFAPDVFNFVLY